MRFGLFLHHQGVITAEQLVAAIERQQLLTPPLGQVAIEAGLVSVHDLFTIVASQSGVKHDRFGDIAVELGLLDKAQLAQVLMAQSDRRPPLREILIDQGVLSAQEASDYLVLYRRHMDEIVSPQVGAANVG